MMRLEFELASIKTALQHFTQYTSGTSPFSCGGCIISLQMISIVMITTKLSNDFQEQEFIPYAAFKYQR